MLTHLRAAFGTQLSCKIKLIVVKTQSSVLLYSAIFTIKDRMNAKTVSFCVFYYLREHTYQKFLSLCHSLRKMPSPTIRVLFSLPRSTLKYAILSNSSLLSQNYRSRFAMIVRKQPRAQFGTTTQSCDKFCIN